MERSSSELFCQHDLEARSFSVSHQADVNTDNSRLGHQFAVVRGQHCVDVAFERGSFLAHVTLAATDERQRNERHQFETGIQRT